MTSIQLPEMQAVMNDTGNELMTAMSQFWASSVFMSFEFIPPPPPPPPPPPSQNFARHKDDGMGISISKSMLVNKNFIPGSDWLVAQPPANR